MMSASSSFWRENKNRNEEQKEDEAKFIYRVEKVSIRFVSAIQRTVEARALFYEGVASYVTARRASSTSSCVCVLYYPLCVCVKLRKKCRTQSWLSFNNTVKDNRIQFK